MISSTEAYLGQFITFLDGVFPSVLDLLYLSFTKSVVELSWCISATTTEIEFIM